MSVRTKLYITVFVLSAFVAIVGAIGIVSLGQYKEDVAKLESSVTMIDRLQEQRVQFHKLNRDLYSFLGTQDDQHAMFVSVRATNVERELNRLAKDTDDPKSKANLILAVQGLEKLKRKTYETLIAISKDDGEIVRENTAEIDDLITLMSNRLANSSLLIENKVANLYAESQRAHDRYIRMLLLASLTIIILGLALGYLLTRGITTATEELSNAAMEFAGGDRHRRVNRRMSGEFAVLGSSFNHMADNIQLSESKIQRWGEELEKEVDARTKELKNANHFIETLYIETITALVEAIEAKDSYTRGHSENVARYALAIGKKMGLSDGDVEMLRTAALLHDIGKIGIREEVLNKPTKLTDEEYEHIKEHPGIAYQIIGRIPGLEQVAEMVLYHHERYDGHGYPRGIRGEGIPLGARILAVADTFDAMTSNRSYRDALSLEVVRRELSKNSGAQFDPQALEIFIELLDSNDPIFKSLAAESSSLEATA